MIDSKEHPPFAGGAPSRAGKGLKRSSLNFLVDALGFVGFALLTTSGVLLRYALPPGSGHRLTIWGLTRHEWGDLHFWMSVFFFAALAIHVWLHWGWVVCVVRGRPREGSGIRLGLGVLGVLTILALALAPFLSPVAGVPGGASREEPRAERTAATGELRGSMTLREMEQSTGVPVAYLLKELGMPADIAPDERLGRLSAIHGFGMSDVRRIAREYVEREESQPGGERP